MELLQEGESNTVQFLDLEVKCQNGKLSTCLYRKPTAVNSLLEYRSFHPKHTRDGIPRGQFLRARRNCTDDEDFRREAHDLTERFRRRNYPKKCISRAYQRAKIQTQDTLLVPTKKETDKFVRFITGYHTQWNQVRDILNNHWRILTADTQTAQVISPRPLVTAKRAPNFRDILTRSHYSRPTHKLNRGIVLKGSFPCGNCTVCTYMHPTRDSFINPTDQTPHRLKSYINCKTSNVIYAIICTCPRVYVGQTTQELRRRIQGHFSTINTAVADRRKGKTLTTVAAHYLTHHAGSYTNTRVIGLEHLRTSDRGGTLHKKLLQVESRWIYQLHSMAPHGINEDLLFTGFLG
ncbi:uncharacterized protein [Ranitomeya imitator]|uniref:uncharacterized protein isoform X1 n=1 Tax=Ranitomeya imitator TaxID=111125 RepID=UPI0037E71578